MGIFTRTCDIVNSNINAALDKAEDPEKLLRHMIREMEETLIEVKAACAAAMAGKRKVERAEAEARRRANHWATRAEIAVERDRDTLAREALYAKHRYEEEAENALRDVEQFEELEVQYKEDIVEIEAKLSGAREKQRVLVHRHRRAAQQAKAQREIRKLDTSQAFVRFEEFQYRLDQKQAESELVNFGTPETRSLEEEFVAIERDEEIEAELRKLKEAHRKPEPVSA